MDTNDSIETELLLRIEDLKKSHKNKDYFRVVILSPLLIVRTIDVLASYTEEWYERKHGELIGDDEREVYKLINRTQKKESDRAYIVGALVDAFNNGVWTKNTAKKSLLSITQNLMT